METELIGTDSPGLDHAAQLLRAGDLVAFPTETVYGLGADARNDTAVAKIFAAKNRPQFNPLIVHVASLAQARELADFSDDSMDLATAFWPGPLTLVVPLNPKSSLSKLVSAGLDTVAIRVPAHPVAQALLGTFSGPLAAPSANPSGRISPTQPEHVMSGLGGQIAGVIDGGVCSVGLESTIIGFAPEPTLLRPGGLPAEAIEKATGKPLISHQKKTKPTSPGQLQSHYAPKGAVRLNANRANAGEKLIGFGALDGDFNLSPSADLVEAAANLFRILHELDDINIGKIAVVPIPNHGLGRAINDRLKRAAAPRQS